MLETLLRTKLFVPPLRPNLVPRPLLVNRLNQGVQHGHKLTLISAPAGFGKTTLASAWLTTCERPVAWLSLDEGDNDPARFLTYLIAAFQIIAPSIGQEMMAELQSTQPPIESILTTLLNEITTIPVSFILVLDDYHEIDSRRIDDIITFLLEHLPPHMHLVVVSRVDPQLPLPRLRARGQMSELRAADLRFSPEEAAEFLYQTMGLSLSTEEVMALETRTEGWIAGLQLAAISMQGRADAAELIKSFTGSHRLILDYLIEEVLSGQPQNVQDFLLQTSILNRLCGPLCDAVTGQDNGQAVLELLDRTNLFIVPLDDERRWYRYHHLFADLLRQRLNRGSATSANDQSEGISQYHKRASLWYEENNLEIEAFQHAAAANDVDRAERLIEGDGLPLSFRGTLAPVLHWLESLPKAVLDAKPSLWVTYAAILLTAGQIDGVEERLQAAEAALQGIEQDDITRDLLGRVADTRGTMAVGLYQVETLITQSRLALEYLDPDNVTYRTSALWKLGVAYEWQGDRAAASKAYRETIAISQASGNIYTNILATVGLADIQFAENQLYQAAETYNHALDLVGDLPIPVAVYVNLCLARIFYEWNDLGSAQEHGQQCQARAMEFKDHSYILVDAGVFLARLKLAQGDITGAAAMLAEASRVLQQSNFTDQMPGVAAVQVLVLLEQGNLHGAAKLAEQYDIPLSQARVFLAQGNASAALATLEPLRRQSEAKNWQDELLKVLVLQALAHYAQNKRGTAVELLADALTLAGPGGFIRTFVDEGAPLVRLLLDALSDGLYPEYIGRLLEAYDQSTMGQRPMTKPDSSSAVLRPSSLVEPLSDRELEVLQLIAEGLTNQEVASKLYLALNTVKAHTRNIYGKLGVNNRTQAVARARDLAILT